MKSYLLLKLESSLLDQLIPIFIYST